MRLIVTILFYSLLALLVKGCTEPNMTLKTKMGVCECNDGLVLFNNTCLEEKAIRVLSPFGLMIQMPTKL